MNEDITDSAATTLKSGMAMASSGIAPAGKRTATAIIRNPGYPDHRIVDVNLDQLRSATAFIFAH